MRLDQIEALLKKAGLFLGRRELPLHTHAFLFNARALIRRLTLPGVILWVSPATGRKLTGDADSVIYDILPPLEPSVEQLLLFAGSSALEDLSLKEYSPLWIGADKSAFEGAAASMQPANALRRIVLGRFSLTQLSPYQTEHHVEDEMFFGRDQALQDIVDQPDQSFAILGPRRAGKSSLAKKLERQLRAMAAKRVDRTSRILPGRVAYVDCNRLPDLGPAEDDFFEAAIASLGVSARDVFLNRPLFGKRQRNLVPYKFFAKLVAFRYPGLTLIIDEVDAVIERRPHGPWPLLRKVQGLLDGLAGSSSDDRSARPRVVVAGFLSLQRGLYDPNFPLHGRLKSILPANLGKKAVRQLVLEPLRELGLRFSNDQDIIRRIILHTGGMPAVVQELCHELLKELDRSGRKTVTAAQVESVIASQRPVAKYVGYFDHIASDLERLIVQYSAPRRNFRRGEFSEFCREKGWRQPDADYLNGALDGLVFANILTEVERGSNYSFAVEAFRQVLVEKIDVFGGEELALQRIAERLELSQNGE